MNFGKTILDLRRAKNVTQEELAAELGVTAAAVSKWENGYTLPDILMLCALADYFEVSTDELLGRCKNPKYTIIAAENEALGQKVAQIAREFGLISRAIYTNYKDAVEAAKKNAAQNGLDNCEFIAGDVLKVLDDVEEKPDFIILDPPRDGIHPKALPKIISYGVERIVYVSCKPTSLARDLEVFLEQGYQVERAVCVDQFPWTANVETVCLLSKG